MKNFLLILSFGLFTSFTVSCQNNLVESNNTSTSSMKYSKEFNESFQELQKFKKNSKNSYSYTVHNSSWSGLSWETTISVENGKVIKRHFKYFPVKGMLEDMPQSDKEWTETGNKVGSHMQTSAADALTLDEVYAKAKSEWLVDRANATFYFETKNNGLISQAGFTDNYCADDCFEGIIIKNIQP